MIYTTYIGNTPLHVAHLGIGESCSIKNNPEYTCPGPIGTNHGGIGEISIRYHTVCKTDVRKISPSKYRNVAGHARTYTYLR